MPGIVPLNINEKQILGIGFDALFEPTFRNQMMSIPTSQSLHEVSVDSVEREDKRSYSTADVPFGIARSCATLHQPVYG